MYKYIVYPNILYIHHYMTGFMAVFLMQRLRGCERPPPCLPSGSWGARPRKWDPGWGCGYISHRHYPHESHIYRYIDVYIDVEWCRYIHSALHVCVHIYICHICLYVYIRCIYIYTHLNVFELTTWSGC